LLANVSKAFGTEWYKTQAETDIKTNLPDDVLKDKTDATIGTTLNAGNPLSALDTYFTNAVGTTKDAKFVITAAD
jgi:hypothetical protein